MHEALPHEGINPSAQPAASRRRTALPPLLLMLVGAVGVFGGIVAALLAVAGGYSARFTETSAGLNAPEFALADQDGRKHHLKDYHGRPVFLLMLPATDPAGSRAALRSFRDAETMLHHLGVKLFGVASAPREELARLYREEQLRIPLLHDEGNALAGKYQPLWKSGQALNVPVTFVVGPDGRIQGAVGPGEREDYASRVLRQARCCLRSLASSRHAPKPIKLTNGPLTETASGKRETLLGNGKQTATLVFVLSTRCPCSQAYHTRVKALADKYARGPAKVRVVALYANADESLAQVREQSRLEGFDFVVARDPGQKWVTRMGAAVTPEAFVIDHWGRVRYHGRIDDSREPANVRTHDLRDALEAVLAGQHPRQAEQVSFGCAITHSAG